MLMIMMTMIIMVCFPYHKPIWHPWGGGATNHDDDDNEDDDNDDDDNDDVCFQKLFGCCRIIKFQVPLQGLPERL